MSMNPAVAQSTYRLCYRGEAPQQPYIRYRTMPRIPCTEDSKQLKRPQEKPIIENELLAKNFRAPSAKRWRPKSPKIATIKPQKVFNTKFGPMGMDEITRLYNKTRYDTFAKKAGREFVLLPMHRPIPSTVTKEEKPDMIVLKGRKYEDSREEWQDAALWDRVQTRVPTERPKTPAKQKLLPLRQKVESLRPEVEAEIDTLVKTDGLANVFVRKCPGYAGYAPLCPPETRLSDKQEDVITSTMRASYRKFPEVEYIPQFYGRKGPLSKTVTLTAPYNPFNKVGEELDDRDKDGRYMRLFTGYHNSSYIY